MINEEKDRKPNPYYEMAIDGKQCIKCKEYKSEDSFYRHNQSKDGLNFWCKDCCKMYYNLKVKNAKT